MGIAYERSLGFEKDSHSHDRDILIFPRGSCRMEVHIEDDNRRFTITSAQILYIPKTLLHWDRGLSAVYDTIALLPSFEYMDQLVAENGLDDSDARILRTQPVKLQRSRWIDDLIERYFFERVINHKSPQGCSFFLEKQILNEFARLVFSKKLITIGPMLGDESEELLARSLRFIEGNLFEALDLDLVCKHVKTNPSTLNRLFRKHLAQTPAGYIKARRLDEAAALLERRDHQVADVCMLVGYDDVSSFTRAFKQRFKVSASVLLQEGVRGGIFQDVLKRLPTDIFSNAIENILQSQS